ncbi:DegT/DnrJ/EryC1/StrS family aminotransferase [Arenimonas sp. MALMAid1274]|uniref:DegT/DnrJ/EryC1/StrS family aminotransferase n=1 Tax=Arenimonas sp. MALMAid1274 TaxID=3411630 RepID=UPI003B9DE6B8
MSSKSIRTPSDLAIHGAAPAFASPVHVGRPNTGGRERFMVLAAEMFERGWLTNNGPMVQELERRICDQLGVKHCIAMCNGTIALEIAVRALGMQGEVIIPSWTFVATAHCLYWQGITPVFADVDPATHNLDPASVRRMITPRTSGIIGVHVWGRPAPVSDLQDIADEHGLALMFDASHAFGCSHQGRSIGSFGRAEVFSFHATKWFNTFEGGAVTTNDDELAEKMRLMRNFGFVHFDKVIHPGTNGKMPEVCAAMGLANLDAMETVLASNRAHYEHYRRALADIPGVRLVAYAEQERNNHHYVVAELDEAFPVRRDQVVATLHAENILARKYFWPGCHRMKPYADLFPHAGLVLPVTAAVSERVVVLPSGTTLPGGTVDTIGDVLRVLAQGT